jgi:sulfonate transport system permease protein
MAAAKVRPEQAARKEGARAPRMRWADLRGAALPILAFAAWAWLSLLPSARHGALFASPGQVARAGLGLARAGALWPALAASLERLFFGFAIGAAAGLALGAALGSSRAAERAVAPTFHALKQVSIFAWIPLIGMWFGLGESGKIAVLAWAAFFPMFLNTLEGVRSVPRELLETGRAFGFTRAQMARNVVLPSALPSVLTGVSLSLLYAWLAALGAEYMLSSGVGLGTLLLDGRDHAMMDQVLFAMAVVGAIGLALHALARRVEARLLRWRGSAAGKFR